MSSSIVVRNLTSTPISIKRVEQFKDTTIQQSKTSGFFFAARNSTSPTPSLSRIGSNSDSLKCLEVDAVLAPFESCTLDQAGSIKDSQAEIPRPNIAFRLTIEDAQGSQHHIDVHPSYTQKYSSTSTSPSSPSSAPPTYTTLFTLFHPTRPTTHLTIHTNHRHDYRSWMSTLPSSIPISALSIPGTHNSHTYYRALPSVRCQAVDIASQLEHGIRFLDIRLQPVTVTRKDLVLVHGAFPISLTGPKYFAPILQICYDFLERYPSELIMMSLKREGIGGGTDEDLARILADHYLCTEEGKKKWWLGNMIPTLGDVRGKMVLVRRYKTTEAVGLDATSWPNSPAHALFPPPIPSTSSPPSPAPAMFCLQDYCDVMEPFAITTKIRYANEHLVRAASCRFVEGVTGPLYLNYLSASNFWNKGCWPEKIASILNRSMEEWLCVGHGLECAPAGVEEPGHVEGGEKSGGHDDDGGGGSSRGKYEVRRKAKGDGGTGVVVMDFVGEGGDWDLVELVVGLNLGLWMKNTDI